MENSDGLNVWSFFLICIDNVEDSEASLVHNRIEISDNEFYGIDNKAIKSGGVRNLIIKNNEYNTDKENIISVNGKKINWR